MNPYELPTSLHLNGQDFKITENGDYRVILGCFKALEDESLSRQERPVACLLLFFEDLDTVDDLAQLGDLSLATKEVFRFINCGQDEYPGVQHAKTIDWEVDAPIIASAMNKIAGCDVRNPELYMHWWTFMGYFGAIGESTLSTVVSIRKKLLEGKNLEKYEREFKRLEEWVRTTLWNQS